MGDDDVDVVVVVDDDDDGGGGDDDGDDNDDARRRCLTTTTTIAPLYCKRYTVLLSIHITLVSHSDQGVPGSKYTQIVHYGISAMFFKMTPNLMTH